MKIVFMGTPNFAVPILEKILIKHEVVLVITQPDHLDRKKRVVISPVKECAIKHQIPVFQPMKIRTDYQEIFNYDFDLIVTAAYGQIIGEKLLHYPKYKSINVHGSILPKYRGGAPIQRAIMNGDKETGITIMYMDKKMDAGDILEIQKIPILDSDTQDTLFHKLSLLGSEMILDVIWKLENKQVNPTKQDESQVTYAYNLSKDDEKIDFRKSAVEIFHQIRGLNSNPGAYFLIDQKVYKIYQSKVSNMIHHQGYGEIVRISKDSFEVSCKNGSVISILSIRPESKNVMSVKDFLNGSGKSVIILNKKIGEF